MTTRTQKSMARLFHASRIDAGLSLRQAEKESGVDKAAISRIESGDSKVSFENAIRLCDAYLLDIGAVAKNYTVRGKSEQLI